MMADSERKLKELLEQLVKENQKKGLITVRKQNLLMSVKETAQR